jgi:3-(3-hydroxy-phenyl)propionate hydroxylase
VWRIDWQLPPETDIQAERESGQLDRRIRQVIGDVPYDIRWMSTYRFHQRVVARFRVGRAFFAGDAAHALPPYGARGMNSGIQDADNLAWKLASVLGGKAGEDLLETYHTERHAAAVENLRVTEATIKFMVPPTRMRRLARNVLLTLQAPLRFLRRHVNAGRMAEPFVYTDSPIVQRGGSPLVGSLAPDGFVTACGNRRRLRDLFGDQFVGLYVGTDPQAARRFAEEALERPSEVPLQLYLALPTGAELADPCPAATVVHDMGPALRATYGREEPTWYLVRPDGHIAASGGADRASEMADVLARCADVRG